MKTTRTSLAHAIEELAHHHNWIANTDTADEMLISNVIALADRIHRDAVSMLNDIHTTV